MVSKRLLSNAIALRRQKVGSLIRAYNNVLEKIMLNSREDFGRECHSRRSEPYFYDASYTHVNHPVYCVDSAGKCYPQLYDINENGEIIKVDANCSRVNDCTIECKAIPEWEVNAIISIRQAFDGSMIALRKALPTSLSEGCPNLHFSKLTVLPNDDNSDVVLESQIDRLGHPLVCHNDSGCKSILRIVRAASTHYPVLRKFLRLLYIAIDANIVIQTIDSSLMDNNADRLMSVCKVKSYASLLINDSVDNGIVSVDDDECNDKLRRPQIEVDLSVEYATLIEKFEKELEDYEMLPCVSCECLFSRSKVTKVKLTDNLGGDVWPILKKYIAEHTDTTDVLYMCGYCKPKIKENQMPARCVLNGLFVTEVPEELSKLDALSVQMIQLAKSYQTVVHLGTYSGKLPSYCALKACRGTMFFLPLPLSHTLETLDELQPTLANPELYIVLNGRPTKNKVIWRSLINVTDVKNAVEKLKDINHLYKKVDLNTLDDAAKKVVEVTSSTTSKMLEQATPDDIAQFDFYTIRNLNTRQKSGDSDIAQYKLNSVKENALNYWMSYLDVMCFPTLFPTGEFGEYHPRTIKVSFSQFAKSRLFNKDSRFRKNPQYVFYLLWQKEMRELNAGIFNLMKSARGGPMSVSSLIAKLDTADEHLESNLCSMLQSIRGTKQYWFQRQSEVKCMVREWGPPAIFLTLSCAEYESPDIIDYLCKVNNVPTTYNSGRLCAEDPVSVSRQFSRKFKCLFKRIILDGEVLGTVDHYYWKKEYQCRGAPHYHILLWIREAPVVGKDKPETVLKWIQERITCNIPDSKMSPELNQLVLRYQMHKCNLYCKRRKKVGNTFITRCRFNFPRPSCATSVLNNVEDSLKSRNRIYYLARAQNEVRVNDYHPLILWLWKANMDIQYIAESSLALAQYVSGYVTKAEKSNLQEEWESISDNKSVRSRLFSFGCRMIRSRECGLYEASDLILGDSLCKKSTVVQWVDVSMPHKRRHRLKDHKKLQQIAESDPDSEDIFEQNLIESYYPNRPEKLEDVCLYDFVANYDYYGFDKKGKRNCKERKTAKLVNHKIFDPHKEDQKDAYYYSLILLFVPFRDEANLLMADETCEEAFNRLLPGGHQHHEKLQVMLKAQENTKRINEAREEEQIIVKEEDEPELVGEAIGAMEDMFDMGNMIDGDLSLEERIAMLNSDQLRIFTEIKTCFLHQQMHEDGTCKCLEFQPFTMFVSGVGGTGKSFLIEAVKLLVDELWPSEDLTCGIAAPTGLAAFNVGGITIHRLFQLPIEHDGKTAEFWNLPAGSKKVMKTSMRSVKLIIIDEVSMVSSLTLAYIHLRLNDLFHDDTHWFGGMNMLFVGDILQLPPVNGSHVFEKVARKMVTLRLKSALAINIWKDCITYNELTINERQKSDPEFSRVLNNIRCGFMDEEIQSILEKRVIDCSVDDKFDQLAKEGQSPVCLFPTRKACSEFNTLMLEKLSEQIHEIKSIDEVDETASKKKWSDKFNEELKKLTDSNQSAGLESVLTVAVGARVMLRRNIDTKAGLVNGALGTVVSIADSYICVKFDHISKPYKVERVRSKFIWLKNFSIIRKQYPLILAFAITIHKCQGLSLNCAIIDLSNRVFSPGMAYVALSRVRSLSGLHLISFDPKSIMVSYSSIQEYNRLRSKFKPDLPQYNVPTASNYKVKLTGRNDDNLDLDVEPPTKKAKLQKSCVNVDGQVANKSRKRKLSPAPKAQNDSKKTKTDSVTPNNNHQMVVNSSSSRRRLNNWIWYPVDERWQKHTCQRLNLTFERVNKMDSLGGPNVPLGRNCVTKCIVGDGNCLFRAFSQIITGSQRQHFNVRNIIVDHMLTIGHILINSQYITGNVYSSARDYVDKVRMRSDRVWGNDTEIVTLANLLKCRIYAYSNQYKVWMVYDPSVLDNTIVNQMCPMSLYIHHNVNHFEVVTDVHA